VTAARPGRPRLPVGPRTYSGRTARLLCVATNLSIEEVLELDRAAAYNGETRAEFIRASIRQRIEET